CVAQGKRRRATRRNRYLGTLIVVVVLAAVAIALAWLVARPHLRTYVVPSASMEPTLTIGQHLTVDTNPFTPAVGDIVIFHPPQGALASPAQSGASLIVQHDCARPTTAEAKSTN